MVSGEVGPPAPQGEWVVLAERLDVAQLHARSSDAGRERIDRVQLASGKT
jgi:hypothetical protein